MKRLSVTFDKGLQSAAIFLSALLLLNVWERPASAEAFSVAVSHIPVETPQSACYAACEWQTARSLLLGYEYAEKAFPNQAAIDQYIAQLKEYLKQQEWVCKRFGCGFESASAINEQEESSSLNLTE